MEADQADARHDQRSHHQVGEQRDRGRNGSQCSELRYQGEVGKCQDAEDSPPGPG
jgi:hypothetical protein